MKRASQFFIFSLFLTLFFSRLSFSQVYFTEGFEGDTTGKFKNVAGSTSTSQKWTKITNFHKFGKGAVRFDTTGAGVLQDGYLEMKSSVDLSTSTLPLLTFWHMCFLENPANPPSTNLWDKAFVMVSVDDGGSWSYIPEIGRAHV